jgi:hypothetical protein
MSRYVVAISVLLAVACHAAFGGGARTLCVAIADSACAAVDSDSCCSDPVDQRCPPAPDGDECCFDVLPLTSVETLIARRVSTDDTTSCVSPAIPCGMLPIPPPANARRAELFGRIAGPPGEVREIVRTSRLLL